MNSATETGGEDVGGFFGKPLPLYSAPEIEAGDLIELLSDEASPVVEHCRFLFRRVLGPGSWYASEGARLTGRRLGTRQACEKC